MELRGIFGYSALADELEKRLAILTPKERVVFLLRRGFDRNGELQTYAAIGRKLGVTRERVRQLYASADRKLKEKSGDEFSFGVPMFSCRCGKYRGQRYQGLWCDKCGRKVVRQGELQTHLVTPSLFESTWSIIAEIVEDGYTKSYKMTMVGPHSIGTNIPSLIVEREARKVGLTVPAFVEQYRIQYLFGDWGAFIKFTTLAGEKEAGGGNR